MLQPPLKFLLNRRTERAAHLLQDPYITAMGGRRAPHPRWMVRFNSVE